MSSQQPTEAGTYPCCSHCEGIAKGDHVGHGGTIEKDGHDSPCRSASHHIPPTSVHGIVVDPQWADDAQAAFARAELAEGDLAKLRALVEEWRKHPAITLDDDGSAHVDLTKIEERDGERIAQYRTRAWDAEHAIERVRALLPNRHFVSTVRLTAALDEEP